MKPFDQFRENYTPAPVNHEQPNGFAVIGGVLVFWCALYLCTVVLFSL